MVQGRGRDERGGSEFRGMKHNQEGKTGRAGTAKWAAEWQERRRKGAVVMDLSSSRSHSWVDDDSKWVGSLLSTSFSPQTPATVFLSFSRTQLSDPLEINILSLFLAPCPSPSLATVSWFQGGAQGTLSQLGTRSSGGSRTCPQRDKLVLLEHHEHRVNKEKGLLPAYIHVEAVLTLKVCFSLSFAQEINFYKVIDYILHGKEDIKVIP